MTDQDDRDAAADDLPEDTESLQDLVNSIKDRSGDRSADDGSLEDLVESIKRRRERAPGDDDTSLTDLAGSIGRRQGEEGETDPEPSSGSSLGELAESIGNRRNRSESGEGFTWAGDDAGTPAVEPDPPALDDIENDSSVLFLGPLARGEADRPCMDLLTPAAPAVDNVLLVTVTQTVDDRLQAWRRHATATPSNLKVVTVGDGTRSAGGSAEFSIEGSRTDITISNVPDPADLARLGITLTRTLSGWEGGHSRVCVHSLTALLQYVDPQHLFRFLHVLRGKCDSLDAAAHYHMDPEAHENQTIRLFTSLFETVVRLEDGGVEITSGE